MSSDPALAMTAPGSPSVLPVTEATDRLPLPVNSGPQIPVSTETDRVTGNPRPSEGSAFGDAAYGNAVKWKKTVSSS